MDKLDLCYYDEVRLKNGSEGTIVEFWVPADELDKYYEEKVLIVEFYDPDHKYEWPEGEDPDRVDYFVDDIRPCDIVEVIYRHPDRLKTSGHK